MSSVVFWDIDGTLLSTGRAGVFALEDAAREVLATEPAFGQLFTAGLTDWQVAAVAIESVGAALEPGTLEAFVRAYEHHLPERLYMRQGSVMPGVQAILEALRARDDVLLMLLTGNTPAGARAKLQHYGLATYFTAGAFSVDSGSRESIAVRAAELAGQRLGSSPLAERMFVVGDTPHDIRCGDAIGARTVAVATGPHSVDELRAYSPWLALERLPDPETFAEQLGLTRGG